MKRNRENRRQRQGAALLVCIFVITMTTVIVVAMFETETLQLTALRHTVDYQRAYFLASAGAHHALAELEADLSWRTGIPSTEFPSGSGSTYSATVADGADDTLVITAIGAANGVTRTIEITLEQY